MYEVETKVRASHEAVAATLRALDADPVDEIRQTDVYYGAPHRDFAARDEALRRRTERRDDDERTVLTYKGPREAGVEKVRAEHETVVEDPTALTAILEALGFEPAATVEKTRRRFDLDGVTVTLDAVDGLGEFVEVETTAAETDLAAARETVADALEALDLGTATPIEASYLELLLEK